MKSLVAVVMMVMGDIGAARYDLRLDRQNGRAVVFVPPCDIAYQYAEKGADDKTEHDKKQDLKSAVKEKSHFATPYFDVSSFCFFCFGKV